MWTAPGLRLTCVLALIFVPLAIESPTFAAPYFRLVPVQPQGLTAPPYPAGTEIVGDTIYLLAVPTRVWFEARYGNWGASDTYVCDEGPNNEDDCQQESDCPGGWCVQTTAIATLQYSLDLTSLSNGDGANLLRPTIACDGDPSVCEDAIGVGYGYDSGGSTNGCQLDGGTTCMPIFLQGDRTDNFPFGIEMCGSSPTFFGCGKSTLGASQADDGKEYYLGTFVLDVPAGAAGTYSIAIRSQGTGMFHCFGEPILEFELPPARVRICDADECGEKNRYVTVSPTTLPTTVVNAGGIRLRALEIDGQPLPNAPPQWVGIPQGYTDLASGQPFYAAELSCTPAVFNWTSLPPDTLIHVFGASVVPSSRYEVRAGDSACIGDPDAWDSCLTLPTFERTAAFGDVIKPFGGTGQPNFLDISALVHAFKILPTAVFKPRAQLAGTIPDPSGAVSFLDIAAGVSAFKGESFPFAGVVYCP